MDKPLPVINVSEFGPDISEDIMSQLIACGPPLLPEVRMRVEHIGKTLNDIGGMPLMRAFHAEYKARTCALKHYAYARELEMAWDGIGDWLG